MLEAHRVALERVSIVLNLRLAAVNLFVNANAAPLYQVLENLLVNAIEAMDKGGALTLVTAQEDRPAFVRITVTDTGPGLSEEMQDRLFRPFATTKSNGTGLGLPLSKRLVEHYDGTLDFHSESGRGVSVRLRLPAVE